MKRRFRFLVAIWVLLDLPAASPAFSAPQSTDFRLSDGSVWRGVPNRLTRVTPAPELTLASMNMFRVGINCALGDPDLNGRTLPAHVPAPYVAQAATQGTDGVFTQRVCADVGADAFSAELRWGGTLTPADANSFRVALTTAIASPEATKPDARLRLFSPARGSITLDSGTGHWIYVNDLTDANKTALALMWPKTMALVKLSMPAATQTCASVPVPPTTTAWSWLPPSFKYSAKVDDTIVGCTEIGGRVLLVEVLTKGAGASNDRRVSLLLSRIDDALRAPIRAAEED